MPNHPLQGIGPGVYSGISNEDYHSGPGYSKSQLDLVEQSPGQVIWSQNAPRSDSEADHYGTAVHCLLLEPDAFDDRYAVGPDCGRKSNADKERWEAFEKSLGDKIPLTIPERDKIHEMHQSVLAHPEAASLLSLPSGAPELSAYWTDPDTGLLCRCRPDWWVPQFRVIVDVKTTEDIRKVHWSIRDYRYDVQEAFYTDGMAEATGDPVDAFLFLFVSKKREMGRYPVKVIELDRRAVSDARAEYKENLNTILECQRSGSWPGVEPLTVPPRRHY